MLPHGLNDPRDDLKQTSKSPVWVPAVHHCIPINSGRPSPTGLQRQEWQIVQSQLDLRDLLS